MLLVMSTPAQPSGKNQGGVRLTPKQALERARLDLQQSEDEAWAWAALHATLLRIVEATLRGQLL